jgi:hypothetical protein
MKIDTETDEGKAEIQKLIEGETKGLKDKVSELLASIKKEKDERKAAQDAADSEKAAREEAEAAAAEKSGDVDKVKKALEEKHATEMKKRDDKIASLEAMLNNHVVDGGLVESLSKAGIAPHLMKAAKALIKTQFKSEVSEKDGLPVAFIDGKAMTDFVKEWAEGEEGKHFIGAPLNGGGGNGGPKGKFSSADNPFKKETRNLTEQGRLKREDPERAKQLAAEAGVSI